MQAEASINKLKKSSASAAYQGRMFSDIIFWVLFVLICGESWNWNYPAYYDSYVDYNLYYEDVTIEQGYAFLVRLFNSWHLHYKYLFLFLFGSGLLLMRNVAKRYLGPNAWIFYLLFFLFPTCNAVAAFRNSVSMFILTFAFPFLLSDKKAGAVKYVALIFLASTIHQTALLYLLLLLKYPFQKRFWRIFLWICFTIVMSIALLFTLFPSYLSTFQPLLLLFVSDNEILDSARTVYISSSAGYGFVIYSGFQLFCIFIVYKFREMYRRRVAVNDRIDKFASLTLFANTLYLFLVVFIKMDSTFFRFFQNLMPINYIAIIAMYKQLYIRPNHNNVQSVYLLFLVVLIAFAIFRGAPWFEYNILPMFLDNWILQLNF